MPSRRASVSSLRAEKRTSFSARTERSTRSFHRITALDGPSPKQNSTSSTDLAAVSPGSSSRSSASSRSSSTGNLQHARRQRPLRSKSLKFSVNSATSPKDDDTSNKQTKPKRRSLSLSKERNSSSLHDMELLQSIDALDEMERNTIMNRNATWDTSKKTNKPSLVKLGDLDSSSEDAPYRQELGIMLGGPYGPKRKSTPDASDRMDGSNSSFRGGSTSFSTQSAALARRFLEDSSSEAGADHELFQDEYSRNNGSSGFLESPSSNPASGQSTPKQSNSQSNLNDSSRQESLFDSDPSDLEWQPDLQRLQQNEWRRYQDDDSSRVNTTKADPRDFPDRPDLRQVDQTVNLMEAGSHREDDPPPPSRRQILNNKKRNDNNTVNFTHQMNSSMEDIWLDASATPSTSTHNTSSSDFHYVNGRRKKKRKSTKSSRSRRAGKRPSQYYGERTCCQDLLCSKMTVFLLVAALLGAFVAWKTGAFEGQGGASDTTAGEDGADNTTTAAPIITAAPVDPAVWKAHHDQESPIMQELEDLLLTLNLASPGLLMDTEPLSPQYMALHWVAHLGADPNVLASSNHKLAHPPSEDNVEDADADSGSDTLMMMSNEDCIRLVAYALAVLFYSTNGEAAFSLDEDPLASTVWLNATNWMQPVPLCEWHGVICEENALTESTVIQQLNLTSNNLHGQIPQEVFQILFSLKALDLSLNALTGPLPGEISLNLGDSTTTPALEYLWLKTNHLTGTVPSSWGNMTQLRNLQVEMNLLTGSLPAEINNWDKMEFLSVHNNEFTGKFPYCEGMKSLERLYFYTNHFSEHLTYEIFRLHTLVDLRASNNEISGTIPPEIENLNKLKVLQLEDNKIEGEVPDVFDHFADLLEVRLQSNQLKGSIPKTFGSLSNLEILELAKNKFTGTIPNELGDLTNLKEFRVHENNLWGTMPESICDLKESQSLQLVEVDCKEDIIKCTCCDRCF